MELAEKATALHGDEPAASSAQGRADRRELAFIAVERTRMPMIVTNPREPGNPIVLANQAFLDLTGYGSDEIIGRNPRFMQGPGTSADDRDALREAIAAERETVVELLNYRKDGSTFWNQQFISPVHDDDGNLLYFFGSSLDVSRSRDAVTLEAAEHRLLKEVDHRAKNALAIVQGIVRLSCADDPERYARAVQRRVDVLARAHGLLADSGWREVSLPRVLASEAALHGSRRVCGAGADVGVRPDRVQPLALLLHEFAANASDHGALSADGAVNVEWHVDEARRRLILTWRESGGPIPSPDPAPGFGLTMIRSIAERQLGGAVNFDFQPAGLEALIEIPA